MFQRQTLDSLLHITIIHEGQKKPIYMKGIPIKDGDIYIIGREPNKPRWEAKIYLYNALTRQAEFDLRIQNPLISRYDPNIGKYGSIYITMQNGQLNVLPAPNTKNIPEIRKISQNEYEVVIGPTVFKVSVVKK